MLNCLIIVPAGKVGHERLCRGVAERLGCHVRHLPIEPDFATRLLAPRGPAGAAARDAVATDASLVLASGRQAIPAARAIAARPQPRPFVAILGHPRVPMRHFDFVWASAHDRPTVAANVFQTLTTPHQLTRERLERAASRFAAQHPELPRPWIVVLIGGPSRAFRFGDTEAEEMATALTTLANSHGASLLVTASRRTGRTNRARLAARLAGAPAYFWDGGGDNPFVGMLGAADYLVVTCDSVSMASEAVFTGRPVYLWPLPGGSAKFDRFHEGLRRHGAIRWFDGGLDRWDYLPLDATASVADEIASRLGDSARIRETRTGG